MLTACATKGPVSEVDETAVTTPDQAITELKLGNERFLAKKTLHQDFHKQIEKTAGGQKPFASVLSCLDSRIPPEILFDQGIGDIFVGRVAGNVENRDLLGSFEFATQLVGTKVLVVLGHTSCGAVKGACAGAKLGNLTGLLDEIMPAVKKVNKSHSHLDKKSSEYYDLVSRKNVMKTIKDIRRKSPVMAKLEKEGKLKIVGAMYDVSNGKVTWL